MLILIFEAVLRMSIYGLLAACLAALAGVAVRRLPVSRSVVLVLWAAAAVRLICPAVIPVQGRVFSGLDTAVDRGFAWIGLSGTGRITEHAGKDQENGPGNEQAVSGWEGADGGSSQKAGMRRDVGIAGTARTDGNDLGKSDEAGRSGSAGSVSGILGGGREKAFAAVWLAGVFAVWGWGLLSTLRFRRRLRFAVRLEEGVYESDAVASSCIAGLLRPKIYLIPGLAGVAREHVLCHEREHIRHGDQIWNILAYMVMGLHWFNLPLWALYRVFEKELEQCCDERVIRQLGEAQKEDYCETLLAMAVRQSRTVFAAPAFGENRGKHDMKKRIEQILRHRKPERKAQAAAFAVAVALGAGLLCQSVVGTEADAEMETETEMSAEMSIGAETGTETGTGPEAETGADAERNPEMETGTKSEIGTKPEEHPTGGEGDTADAPSESLPPELVQLAEDLYAKKNPYLGDAPADGALLELLRPYLPDTGIMMELETDERPYTLRLRLSEGPMDLTDTEPETPSEDAGEMKERTDMSESDTEALETETDAASDSGTGKAAGQEIGTDSAAETPSMSEDSLQFPTLYADLYRPAGVFLALIGNLDTVAFEYPDADSSEKLSVSSDDQDNNIGVQKLITEYYDADWFAGNQVTPEDIKAYGESAESVQELLVLLGFNGAKPELFYEGNHSIAIIGGADGPTSIFLAGKLG